MIDLHFHSTHSDGKNTSEELAHQSMQLGLKLIACTDHDIVNRTLRDIMHRASRAVDSADTPHVLEGAEVSIQERGNSLHVTTYADHFGEGFDVFLTGIREGKSHKIQLQCETLGMHGFEIQLPDNGRVPFSLTALLERFPMMRSDNLNNAHIQEAWAEVESNHTLLTSLTGEQLSPTEFLRQCLKTSGKHTKFLSLPHDVPPYEPSFSDLISSLEPKHTIIALPHVHVTWQTPEIFEGSIAYFVDQGLNGIELSSTTPDIWRETILRVRDRYSLILTLGSDSHAIGRVDPYHGAFGHIHPSLVQDPEFIDQTQRKILEHLYQ